MASNFSELTVFNGTTVGSTVIYSCNAGYNTSHSLMISCHSDGKWGDVPTCAIIGKTHHLGA